MKNVVVLSGGGMKCAYQIGAIKALKEKDISIDVIMGTSGGALNASLIAQNNLEDLEFIWETIAYRGLNYLFDSTLLNLSTLKINWFNLIKTIVNPFRGKSFGLYKHFQENLQNINYLATSTKLVKILIKYTKKGNYVIPFKFNATQLNTGEEVVFTPTDFYMDEELAIAIASSASIPVLLNPLDITTRNKTYYNCVDGGVSSNIMISEAVTYIKEQENPKEWRIIVINANSNKITFKQIQGITNIISRVFIDIMLSNISKKELKLVNTYNKMTSNFLNIEQETYYNIPTIHIQPKETYGGTLDINREIYIATKTQGYNDTLKFF